LGGLCLCSQSSQDKFMQSDKVWFITGSSSGLGRGLVEGCIERGFRVVATARNPASVSDLALASDRVITPALNVEDPGQAREAVQCALDAFGRIDVLVNNAGFVQIGALETVADADVRAQFDVNVFGVLNVLRAALPVMRGQR